MQNKSHIVYLCTMNGLFVEKVMRLQFHNVTMYLPSLFNHTRSVLNNDLDPRFHTSGHCNTNMTYSSTNINNPISLLKLTPIVGIKSRMNQFLPPTAHHTSPEPFPILWNILRRINIIEIMHIRLKRQIERRSQFWFLHSIEFVTIQI